MTGLTKSALGDLTRKARASVQFNEKGIQRTLERDTAAQLKQETDEDRQGKTALANEVRRLVAMGFKKGLPAQGASEFRQYETGPSSA